MRQLTRSDDGRFATDLEDALAELGIASQVTTESMGFFRGGLSFIVWIDEHADPAKAQQAIERAKAKQTGSIEQPASRVSTSEGLIHCRCCRYDLRGQTVDGNCPECGHPYYLIKQKKCHSCGENVPADFEICWNCDKATEPQ